MPTTYTPSLRLALPQQGTLDGMWGTVVNNGITALADAAIAGTATIAMSDADRTLTAANEAADEARSMALRITGTLTAQRAVICPAVSKLYLVENATTGGHGVNVRTPSGAGTVVAPGARVFLYCNGVAVVPATSADLTAIQNSTPQWLTNVTGTSAITASANPPITAYVAGQTFRFMPAGENPGPATININGLGARNILREDHQGPAVLAYGDIPSGTPCEIIFDGTQFQLRHAATASRLIVHRITGVNLNSLHTPGVYNGNMVTNIPPGIATTDWVYVEVMRHVHSPAEAWVLQRLTSMQGAAVNRTWVRQTDHAGAWTPWREQTSAASVDPSALPTAVLGSGTADATTVLRGDRTFQPLPSQTQIQNSTPQWLTNVTGTSALTGNLTPPITAYVPGQTFRFIWPHNTPSPGPLTLSINGLPPVSIRSTSARTMEAGDLPPWALVEVIFNGSVFLTTHAASATDVVGVAQLLGFSRPSDSISHIGRAGPEIGNLSNGAAALTFHRHGAFAANFGLDTDSILKIGGWSFGNVAHQIAHGGNPNPTSINTGALGSGTADATTVLCGDRVFRPNPNTRFISGQNLNSITESGTYDGNNLTNAPNTEWWAVEVIRHSGFVPGTNTNLVQRITGLGGQTLHGRSFVRTCSAANVWTAWQEIGSLGNQLAHNGWQHLAGGLILQWMHGIAGANQSSFINTFPRAFQSVCFVAFGVHIGGGVVDIATDSGNMTTTTVGMRTAHSTNVGCLIFAIGA